MPGATPPPYNATPALHVTDLIWGPIDAEAKLTRLIQLTFFLRLEGLIQKQPGVALDLIAVQKMDADSQESGNADQEGEEPDVELSFHGRIEK